MVRILAGLCQHLVLQTNREPSSPAMEVCEDLLKTYQVDCHTIDQIYLGKLDCIIFDLPI